MRKDDESSGDEGLLPMTRRSFLKVTGLMAGTVLMPLKGLISGKGELIEGAAAQSGSGEDFAIFGNEATGVIENGEHSFKLEGSIKRLFVGEGATVKVNGEEVTEEEMKKVVDGQCLIGN